MRRYHGTDDISAQQILDDNINVARGGGELGQGFYVGNLAHQAATWAYHKGRRLNTGYKVISFEIIETDFYSLHRKYLSKQEATLARQRLRKKKEQRIYKFGADAIIAPVVGKYIPNFTQIKFEGQSGENFINATRKAYYE